MSTHSPFDSATQGPVFFDESLRMLRDQIRRLESALEPPEPA